MTKYWLYVVIAAGFEVFWVAGLKHAETALEWSLTVIAIIMTFFLVSVAAKYLPIGTVYAMFAGLGTAGTVVVEILVYGEPFRLGKVLLIGALLVGVIGLKMVSNEPSEDKGAA